jgi:hypothetical protein
MSAIRSTARGAMVVAGLVIGLLSLRSSEGRAQSRTGGPQCLRCHGDREIMARAAERNQGDSALFRPEGELKSSAHRSLACGECHRGQDDGFPHRASVKVLPCESCHQDQGREWTKSVHAVNAVTEADAPTCVGCHGSHEVKASSDARSPTYPLNVAAMCGRCHNDPKIIGRYFSAADKKAAREAPILFPESVHGVALDKSGLLVAATCSDCHRAHLILPADSTNSSVSRANMSGTCGVCHAKVSAQFDSSAHGVNGTRYGNTSIPTPVCADCHSAHGIPRADRPDWQLAAIDECGTCHKRVTETYRQTYHGKVTQLGFGTTVAKCSDCHTAHGVRGRGDSLSSVHGANLVATCAKCHPKASEKFTKYYAHGDYRDREKYPLLYWPWLLMTTLLVSVWVFFAVHIALWFIRTLLDRRKGKGHGHASAPAGGGVA